ncbi:MAG: ACT domain-containing protein [Bacteroidales bacterium]|nr:ACT domain-containing protein [Bacteroidales bacterium]
MKKQDYTVIELLVHNHPGVMSHITGLFSRRGYNLEGILCGSIGEGTTSIMYLLVKENQQLIQIVNQLEKLHDVLDLKLHPEYDHSVFYTIDKLLKGTI